MTPLLNFRFSPGLTALTFYGNPSVMNKSFEFENRTTRPISIQLEPWGEDYTLKPGERFSIGHESNSKGYVSASLENNWLSVYIEGDWDYPDLVTIDDRPVECGYGRELADLNQDNT